MKIGKPVRAYVVEPLEEPVRSEEAEDEPEAHVATPMPVEAQAETAPAA